MLTTQKTKAETKGVEKKLKVLPADFDYDADEPMLQEQAGQYVIFPIKHQK